MRERKLLVLTPKPKGLSPGQRFRLEQWGPRVEARHGIRLDFLPFESPELTKVLYEPGHKPQKAFWVMRDFLRRASSLVAARDYDGVVVYREAALIGPAIYERLFAWTNKPLFFDFDDSIWQTAQISPANGVFSLLHFWGKTSTTCKLASAVLVGNRYLADYAEKRNRNVFVIPTSIELEKYPVQPELEREDPFVVCWTGSTSTLAHFEEARRPLERLAARRKIVVKVICNRPPNRPIAGAENLFVPWTEKGEAEEVGASHVGIMPLPDDDYSKGKCGLKALQYMATGRPVVIAPVGMNVDLVKSGENGFLARTDDEWVDALEKLAASPDSRRTMGAAGRKTIEERFSAEVVSELFAEAVTKTLVRATA
ncbi:MAG: glycosyltransferase [Deltaproteobacteria bacterium]|nr:glycosyltransferase [Deltaproteobacteria bacterium]